MKRILPLAASVAFAMAAHADSYNYLTFQMADGTLRSIAASSLTLTLSNGQLVASNATDSQTYTLTDLRKMFFAVTSGISSPATDDRLPVEVFTMDGLPMGRFSSIDAARKALKKGIYIVKDNSRILKLTVK